MAFCQQVYSFQLINVFDELIDSYVEQKVGVAQEFLTAEFTKELRHHLIDLIDENKLKRAKIGSSNGHVSSGSRGKLTTKGTFCTVNQKLTE